MHAAICAAALVCLAALGSSPASGSARASFTAGIVWAEHGIFAASADGSGVRRLVPGMADAHYDPAWSSDGGTLVFSTRNSDSVDVHLYDAETEELTTLALRGRWVSPRRGRTFSYLLEGSWAPDGEHIAFSDFSTPVDSRIKIASLETRRLRPLTTPRRGNSHASPAWSPGGNTIALVRRRNGAAPLILLVGPDGRGLRRLTHGVSPSWSPDGRRLVFAWGDSIYRIDVDGRSRTRLARNLPARGARLQPRWSPDGRTILFTTARGIWTMDADGTDRARIVHREFVVAAGWRSG